MKFSDGHWLIPETLSLLHPLHIHEVRIQADTLVAYVTTRVLTKKGDQLETGMFTLRLFAPAEGVIGVRLSHFDGGVPRGPALDLPNTPGVGTIRQTDDTITLHAGGVAARLPRAGRFALDFLRDGQRITGTRSRSGGHATDANTGKAHMFERLDLGVGDLVYGLGERFGAFVKNGQSIEIWNRDGGTATEQAYKNIPFFMTNRGWGVYVNNPGRVEFEIGSEKTSKAQFSVPGEELEYYLIDGPTPREVLGRYTGLTGRPALPPMWSFGLWLSTSFTTDYDEATVKRFTDGMRQRDIPVGVFHFDTFWMRGMHWCDFEWDPEVFPDPEGQLARMKANGLRICLWINPYISQMSPLFAGARDAGYLLKRPNGDVWQTDKWQPGMGIVDFTNPEAADWYNGHLKRLLGMGVDAFKTDFGERIPTDVVWHDGSDPERMHNFYAYLYNKSVFEMMQAERGGDAIVFARSAWAGSQQFPVHWGGDCESDYASMAESLRGGLSLALSGFGYWSHDIGGFEGTAEPDVYKRWCAFGLMSSHSRLHGSESYRVPWDFDEEAVDVLRFFTGLKCRLMPYLAEAARTAHEDGIPMMRPMVLEFPEDPGAATLDRQYMFGPNLLVAPVFSPDGGVEVYLPPGRWTHLLTGAVKTGGWHRETHGYQSLPLYVRAGSLIAVGASETTVEYDFAEGVTLELYALEDGESASCAVPTPDGRATALQVTVTRTGDTLAVAAGGDAAWTLLLVNMAAGGEGAAQVERGTEVVGRDGLTLTLG